MSRKNIEGPKPYTTNSAKPGNRIVSNEDNQPSRAPKATRKAKGGFRSKAAAQMMKG